MTRYRMPAGDVAWLRMDRPTNLMVVNSVMWFDEPLDVDELRGLLRERLLDRFPRFTQKVVERGSTAWWEDDETFDLDNHLHRATLPAPGGRAELENYVSWTLHKSLPPDRPLWEMYLVDGYLGHGSALLARIHHCIADGIALTRLMYSLTDDPADAARADVAPAAIEPAPGGFVPRSAQRVGRAVGGVATALVGDAAHPARLLDLARGLTASGRATAKLVLLPPERRSALHGHPGRGKRVIWTDPIPLPSVKDAAHAAGVTVNDLLLTAVSGALRAHLAREDGHAPDIRAILPYNVRPPDQPLPRELGNKFGLVFLDLPVSVDDPHERLAEVRRRTAAVKRSAEGEVSFQILGLVGHTFRAVERIFVDVFAAKGSAVVTNVPGPTRPVYLTGRKVCGTIGWPPESGDITLGVSIISYDGQLVLGLMADTRVVRDAHLILARTVHELDGLLRSCRAEPAVPA